MNPVENMVANATNQLQSSTTKELQKIGFDSKDFEDGLQKALDTDAKSPGEAALEKQAEPEPKVEQKPEAKPAAKETPKAEPVIDDIPGELLGEKKEPAKEPDLETVIKEGTAGLSKKAADRFRELAQRKHEAEQRLAAREAEFKKSSDEMVKLQKQLQEVEQRAKTTTNNELVESLQKKIEELDGTLHKVALAEHPKFKSHYDGKIETEVARAAALVGKGDADEVSQLLRLPDSKQRNARIAEIADTLDPVSKTKLLSSVDSVDRVSAERAAELANWKQNTLHIERMKAQEEQQKLVSVQEQAKKQQEEAVKAWDTTINRLTSDQGLEVFRKVEGNDEWNTKVDALIEHTRGLFSGNMSNEQLVEAAAKSAACDRYRDISMAQRQVIKKLSEELKALKVAEPGTDTSGEGLPAEDKGDFISAVDSGLRGQGILR